MLLEKRIVVGFVYMFVVWCEVLGYMARRGGGEVRCRGDSSKFAGTTVLRRSSYVIDQLRGISACGHVTEIFLTGRWNRLSCWSYHDDATVFEINHNFLYSGTVILFLFFSDC